MASHSNLKPASGYLSDRVEAGLRHIYQIPERSECWGEFTNGDLKEFTKEYEDLHSQLLDGEAPGVGALNAQLASIELFGNQFGEKWALGVALNCQWTPIDFAIVGVKRGRVAIRAEKGALIEPLKSCRVERDGNPVMWQLVGPHTAPMWIVDAGDGPIGYLTDPDHLCRLMGQPNNPTVRVTFSAYIKDLHRIELAETDNDSLLDKSYSFLRSGAEKLGPTKQAILTVLAARSMGADGFIELAHDTRNLSTLNALQKD